jgi:hypothetical protein
LLFLLWRQRFRCRLNFIELAHMGKLSCKAQLDNNYTKAAYLSVDRAGAARHCPGMAQKSTDEARRPPGTGPFVNRRSP